MSLIGWNTLISPQISSSGKLVDCRHQRARKEIIVGHELDIQID